MFKKIVVPLNGTPQAERSLPVARAVAESAGVPIELVTSKVGGVTFGSRGYLHGVSDKFGVPDYSVHVGPTYLQPLLDERVSEGDALVCITSGCRSGIYQRLFGSMGTDLIQRTKAPFLVVGPRADVDPSWRPERLVVCTDGSDTSRAVVPLAADWLHGLDASCDVLQVFEPADAGIIRETAGDAIEASVVRQVAGELGHGEAVDWDVLHAGSAAHGILDALQGRTNTVVAMATHGRSGLAHVTLGSVTDEVIRRAPCPVLTVRPENLRAG